VKESSCGQFHQHFLGAFFVQNFGAKNYKAAQSAFVQTFGAKNALLNKNRTRKMLMKLTPERQKRYSGDLNEQFSLSIRHFHQFSLLTFIFYCTTGWGFTERKFVRFFVSLGLKISKLFSLKVLFEAGIIK